jgi:hypothetical protein
MDFEKDLDLLTDTIEEKPQKKKVNGKAKGNRGELLLCKLLTKHFGLTFTRGVGSGNRWAQVSDMPQHAKDTFLGDICVPEGFLWVLECKDGYEDEIDLNNLNVIATLDGFIAKVERDSVLSGRKPIICWKRKWKPWLAIMKNEEVIGLNFDYMICYRDWRVVDLEILLNKTEKEFWFG